MPLLLLASICSAAEFSFVVVGDMQTDGSESSINSSVFPQMVEDMNLHSPDVGLFVGDLVGGAGSVSGTVAQWQDFKDATAVFDGVVLPILGNHDVYGGAGTFDAFADTFDWLPRDDNPPGEAGVSYVYDLGPLRFVAVTSDQEVNNPYALSGGAMTWLREKLEEDVGAEHTFVYTHHPVSFSDESGHGDTGGEFWQTLVAYDVAGLFSGHWHRYQPSQLGNGGSTWETIIGTGGGWQGYSPIRPYQQRYGFLLVEVDGPVVEASFWVDDDGDGHYDDEVDRYVMRSDAAQTLGLVAEYTFEDGVQDTAPRGRSVHGELRGDAEIVEEGPSGKALRVQGSDDFMVAGAVDDYVLALKEELSLSLWVKQNASASAAWGNTLITYATNDYYTEDEETNYQYWLNVEPDGTLRSFWEYESGNNVSLFSDPSGVDDGDWHHVVVTRTSDTVVFYVDGGQVGDAQSFERLPTGGGRGMLYLGADTEGSGSYELNGFLDEVCVFDVALGGDAVAALADGAGCLAVLDGEGDTGQGDTGDSGDGDSGDSGADDSEAPDETAEPETQDPTEIEAGCGCSSPGSPAGWLGLLGVLLLRRRSERGHVQRDAVIH